MRIRSTLLAMAVAACAALPSQATVLPYKNLEQLTKEADGIVIGTVQGVQAVAGAQGDVYTFVTIDPQEVISGRLESKTLTLRLKGGFDGQRGLHVEGAPSFQVNERVLLFVQGNGRDLVPFVGWSQGVFRLIRGDAGGADLVVDADGLRVVGLRGNDVLREDGGHTSVHVLGAPNLSVARGEPPQASAGLTDDGSPVIDMQARAIALPAMTLERFIGPVRTAAGAGRVLHSVGTVDARAAAESLDERHAQPAPAATHRLATPAGGAVSEPARKPAAPVRGEPK